MENVLQWLEHIPTGFFLFAGAVLTILIGVTRFVYRNVQHKRLKKKYHTQDVQQEQHTTYDTVRTIAATMSTTLQNINEYSQDIRTIVRYPTFYDTKNPLIHEFYDIVEQERNVLASLKERILSNKPKRKYTEEEQDLIDQALQNPHRLQEAFTTVKLQVETRGWQLTDPVDQQRYEAAERALNILLDTTQEKLPRITSASTLHDHVVSLAEKHMHKEYTHHLKTMLQDYITTIYTTPSEVELHNPSTPPQQDDSESDTPEITTEEPPPARDPERIPTVLHLLERYAHQEHDNHLGKLLSNIAEIYDVPDVYFLEDDLVIDYLSTETRAASSTTEPQGYRHYALIEALQEYWEVFPDFRLGQIVSNIAQEQHTTVTEIEDKILILSLLRKTSSGR